MQEFPTLMVVTRANAEADLPGEQFYLEYPKYRARKSVVRVILTYQDAAPAMQSETLGSCIWEILSQRELR